MKELVKKLRKYEIKIRKIINSQRQGEFRSIFKGSGLEFDDVRTYQYGDDIRTINWNVSAKGHGTFVNTFIEEKEQTVFFILDVSASQEIGSPGSQKVDVSKELCGVLALTALNEHSRVGLLCFSDQREKYVKPSKGKRQAYEILSSLVNLKPKSSKTDLNRAMIFTLNAIKRRSIIIFISDFLDNNYLHNLKALAKKHDLIAIHLSDRRETQLPRLGIIPVLDKESKKTIWVNSSSGDFRSKIVNSYEDNTSKLQSFCRKNQADYLNVNTQEDYVPKLIKLFRVRNKSMKSA